MPWKMEPQPGVSTKRKADGRESASRKKVRSHLATASYQEGAEMLKPEAWPEAVPESPESQGGIQASLLNAQVSGSKEAKEDLPREVRQQLEAKGYLIYAVNSLNVLNSVAKERPDAGLGSQNVGQQGYRAVTSGTFYYPSGGKNHPAGAVMRDGVLDTPGVDKAKNRGGVAVLQDGSIVVGRMQGNTTQAIQSRFGQSDNGVKDFMGGGALLVENGQKVSSKDLKENQKFDQGAGGLDAQQMRQTHHIVVGIRNGRCFVIVALNKTGRQIQNDLVAAGFGSVVKYDGGSGGYARDTSGIRASGVNPTGFGIR